MNEPGGNSPDREAAGEPGLPGEDRHDLTFGAEGDGPGWPVMPSGYEYSSLGPALVTFDCEHWYEVPEGTSLSDFVDELRGKRPKVAS